MALHRAPLLVGEAIPLEQDLVRDRDLADVVQRACVTQQPAALLVEAHAPRDQLAHPRHPLGVMPGLRIAELGRISELADGLCLGATELQLGATQPGDGIEELFLGTTPLCQLHLEALVEARVVERDRRDPAEPVEERDLLLVEAGRVAAREADHPQDAFGSAKRRADDRADRHRPEPLRFAGVARRGRQPSAARLPPLPDLRAPPRSATENPICACELTDARHDGERLPVRLEKVEKRVVDADERRRPRQDQAEKLRHLVAVGNEQGGLVQRVELRPREGSVRGNSPSTRRPTDVGD